MTAVTAQHFLVQRKDLRQTRVAETRLEPAPNEVLLAIEKFALTANNITYAVFGEAMQYWNFFPLPKELDGWGRVPVWGFAKVVESKHADIKVGERVYGYFPMSTHLVVQPDKVSEQQFMDGAAHRRALATPYQVYGRLPKDPMHDAAHEDERAILHPLFFTSWLIVDFLSDNQWFGAKQVVIASASSKTALGVAFMARQHGKVKVIGLTSPGNKAFCEKLGYYDEVVTYDAVTSIAKEPSVYVDMAGNGKLLHAVHHHFAEQMKYSCIVGATHWEDRQTQHALPGAKPQFFFAPTQVVKRTKDWGYPGLQQRLAEGWRAFLPSVSKWLQVRHGKGAPAMKDIYREVLEGRSSATVGQMLSF